MKVITISKPDKKLSGRIHLPASKSISNRLLIIDHLSGKSFNVSNLSKAEDTLLLQKLLTTISRAAGKGKLTELDASHAGTVMRFLTAVLAVTPGKWMLTGSERMKQRPIGHLVDALVRLGAKIDYLAKPGFPPLLITGHAVTGSQVTIESSVSSQFISALMLISPGLPKGLELTLTGKPVSSPYSLMTAKLMQLSGIHFSYDNQRIKIEHGSYKKQNCVVEADWSAAAFWYEAAVFADEVDLILEGLSEESLQGDSVLPELYKNFGIRTEFMPTGIRLTKVKTKIDGFYFDFSDHPDIAQAVITTCAGIGIRGVFEGVGSLQIKETDRLRALKSELEKMGIRIVVSGTPDAVPVVELKPSRIKVPDNFIFETYGDHRMAMTIAPVAFLADSLKIRNPDVVVKSYPDFWDQLKSVGFIIL